MCIMNKFVVFCIVSSLLIYCTSDRVVDLGCGYKYRDEGGDINDIYCEQRSGGFIPANVLDYAYNDKFIVARQHPKLPPDPLCEINFNYPEKVSDFYWIILKNEHVVLGPFLLYDYLKEKKRLNICLEFD